MNDYYDVFIKEWRLKEIDTCAAEYADYTWNFIEGSIVDKVLIDKSFITYNPAVVVNLDTQAGVLDFVTIL